MITRAERERLQGHLAELYSAICEKRNLFKLFEENWYSEVSRKIEHDDWTQLRDWATLVFETYQVRWAVLLDKIEMRLEALSTLPFGRSIVSEKMRRLQCERMSAQFRPLMFELCVLGSLALEGVLTGVEVRCGKRTIDGRAAVQGRSIYVEVTLSRREETHPPGGSSRNDGAMTGWMKEKIGGKSLAGGQLALAKGAPTILVIGCSTWEADRVSAHEAIRGCFANSSYNERRKGSGSMPLR